MNLHPAAWTAIGSGIAVLLMSNVDALSGWKLGSGHSFLSGLFVSALAYALIYPFLVPHLPGDAMVWGLASIVFVPLIQYYGGSRIADAIAMRV